MCEATRENVEGGTWDALLWTIRQIDTSMIVVVVVENRLRLIGIGSVDSTAVLLHWC